MVRTFHPGHRSRSGGNETAAAGDPGPYPASMNLARAVVLLAAASTITAACGGPTTVETASLEKNVVSSIDGPGSVEVETVDCPQDKVPEVGTTFTCSYALTDGS